MPPTITATGASGMHLVGLAYLVASSATFQGLVGAASAAVAFERVHYLADDLSDSLHVRPRALVCHGGQYARSRESVVSYLATGDLVLCLELPPSVPPASESRNYWDEVIEHCNRVDAIVSEMEVLSGTGTGYIAGRTHLCVEGWDRLEGPQAQSETPEAASGGTSGYYWFTTFAVRVKGR